MKLSELPRRIAAVVERVEDLTPNDAIARRLRELGFVRGERVEVMAAGPVAAEPLLVQVGFTRFALRRAEAARVRVHSEVPGATHGKGDDQQPASKQMEAVPEQVEARA